MTEIKSIYLAGKITENHWRTDVVDGLTRPPRVDGHVLNEWPEEWPVLRDAILGKYDYTGPYYMDNSGGHGNFSDIAQDGQHGTGTLDAPGSDWHSPKDRHDLVYAFCIKAMDRSDAVFAWLESTDAYGTFAEIGYAKGKGKVIIIGGPYIPQLWFMYQMADEITTFDPETETATPLESLESAVSRHNWYEKMYAVQRKFDLTAKTMQTTCKSPAEVDFIAAWRGLQPDQFIEWNYAIEGTRYKVDFAHPASKTAIEIDGYTFHQGKGMAKVTEDYERQDIIERKGWYFKRFTAHQIREDVEGCVERAWEIIRDRTPQ